MTLLIIIFSVSGFNIAAEEEIKSEIGKYSKTIFYNGNNPLVKKEIEDLLKRKINFKVQTTFNVNVKIPQENAISEIENILTDIKSFNEIIFHSERTETTTALFKNISIIADYKNEEDERIIVADITISPFRPVLMKFTITKDNNFIMFKAYNLDKVKYWILPIVDEEKMLIICSGELEEKVFNCYGLGVADTGSFFIFRKTIEEEFIGRAQAIIDWFYALLKTKLEN